MPPFVAAVLSVIALVAATLSPTAAGVPRTAMVDDLPLGLGPPVVQQRPRDGLAWKRPGTWSLVPLPSAPGSVRFEVAVEPPETSLEPWAGPGVVFARLFLRGDAGGDMGWEGPAGQIVAAPAVACSGSPCRHAAVIELPTAGILPAIEAQPDVRGFEARVGVTLIRTFGAGRWLQVLPLVERNAPSSGGSLLRPAAMQGLLPSFGAFPVAQAVPTDDDGRPYDYAAVVEELRQVAGDPTSPIPVAETHLELALSGCDDLYWVVALHDEHGNLAFLELVSGRRTIRRTVSVILGRPWTLTSHGEEGIFEYGVAGHRVGRYVPRGVASIRADLVCGVGPTGTMVVTHTPSIASSVGPADLVDEAGAIVQRLVHWLAAAIRLA
jgi:hypothetical protein